VLRGEIDVGPLDSYVHDLLRRHEPETAAKLRVVDSTAMTPIPLLVASPGIACDAVARLRRALLSCHCEPELAATLGTLLVSQVSAGHKNSLRLEIDGAREAIAFDQEDAEVLWCGRRDHVTLRRRDATVLSPDAARLSVLPAGHPQGYQDCFDLFVADVYEAIRTGTPPEGLPQFADGLRAAQITDAVLRSAREGRWVDVDAAPRPLEALS